MTDASLTVLAVDDEPPLTDLYAAWLGGSYEVTTAQSGSGALELVADGGVTPDVVLLDRQMPGLSGGETLERLRAAGVDCPVVMVTGVEPTVEVVEMPFDDYLCKPVGRDELVETVESSLARSRYDERIREYFALARKKAVLEASDAVGELRENSTYEDLCERLDRTAATADGARDRLLDWEAVVEYD